jgi:hypothetical protein
MSACVVNVLCLGPLVASKKTWQMTDLEMWHTQRPLPAVCVVVVVVVGTELLQPAAAVLGCKEYWNESERSWCNSFSLSHLSSLYVMSISRITNLARIRQVQIWNTIYTLVHTRVYVHIYVPLHTSVCVSVYVYIYFMDIELEYIYFFTFVNTFSGSLHSTDFKIA